MKEQYYTLELHKILELLAEQCSNEASKKAALEIEPDNDISNVRAEVDKTFDAYNACVRFGSPSFINFPNAKTIAHRAQSGSELSFWMFQGCFLKPKLCFRGESSSRTRNLSLTICLNVFLTISGSQIKL